MPHLIAGFCTAERFRPNPDSQPTRLRGSPTLYALAAGPSLGRVRTTQSRHPFPESQTAKVQRTADPHHRGRPGGADSQRHRRAHRATADRASPRATCLGGCSRADAGLWTSSVSPRPSSNSTSASRGNRRLPREMAPPPISRPPSSGPPNLVPELAEARSRISREVRHPPWSGLDRVSRHRSPHISGRPELAGSPGLPIRIRYPSRVRACRARPGDQAPPLAPSS